MSSFEALSKRLDKISNIFWAFYDGHSDVLRDDWRDIIKQELDLATSEVSELQGFADGAADVRTDERFLRLLEAMHLLLTHVKLIGNGSWAVHRSDLDKTKHGHVLEHFLDGRQNWGEFLRASNIDQVSLANRLNEPQAPPVQVVPPTQVVKGFD